MSRNEQDHGPDRARREAETRWREAMVAAQAGDSEAYQRLLEELLPVVRRQVQSRLRGAGSEDVVQNALLSIHRARHTYRPERPFGPWLRAIVRNATIDALRDLKRRGEREVAGETVEWLPDPASGRDSVGREMERREISPELAAALAELPDGQRQAVELIQLQGLSIAEAAAHVGVTTGALKVRAHRGYRALRARLGKGDS
ncbi:MAG: sigma-70 family RNA polymerase sigma factor [Myxococcota bacterium]